MHPNAFVQFFLLFTLTLSENPGVRLQANQNAINYMKSLGVSILNKRIKEVSIPNLNGKESIIEYWLSNIHITSFNAPDNQASIQLKQPNGVSLSVSVAADLAANYKVRLGSGWLHVDHSGSITASASGAANAAGSIVSQNGKPKVELSSCNAHISSLHIEFHGNLIDDILDLFKGVVEGIIKDKLNSIICNELRTVVLDDANSQLADLPTSIQDHSSDFFNNFGIDYSLVGNPLVEGNTASLGLRGKLWYKGHQNDAGIPKAKPTPAIRGSSKMFCINMDVPEVIGSGGYALLVSGKAHLLIDKAFISKTGLPIGPLFECNCSVTCIGKMVPQIQSKCGIGGTIEIEISLGGVPKTYVNSTGAYLAIEGKAALSGRLPSGRTVSLFAVRVTASAVVPSSVVFDHWKIKGQVHITNATLTLADSNIGDVDQKGLEQIWKMALMLVVEQELNKLAQKGIQLPPIPYVTVEQPELYFGSQTLTLCFNAKYGGPTLQ